MRRIMVGADGSHASTGALSWAGTLAAATGAEVTLLHSFRPPYIEMPMAEHERLRAERAEIMGEQWAKPAIDAGATVRVEIVDGDARHTLVDAAHRGGADLLVLGRSGAGGKPGVLHLGSVVEHAAHHIERPLAVIPADVEPSIHRIVVGVDGSPDSLAAVAWCADVAPKVAAEVVAVTAQEPVAEWTPSWDERNWRRDTERDLEAWTAPLAAAGVSVTVAPVEHPRPADALFEVAAERGADLVVIGTRGRGGFLGLRFGGIAMKALHHATLPLVLVPPVRQE